MGLLFGGACAITIDGTFKKNKEGFVNIAVHALGYGMHQECAGGLEYTISPITLAHAYVPSEQASHVLMVFDMIEETVATLKLAPGDDARGYLKKKIDQVVIDGGSALWSAVDVIRNAWGWDALRATWCVVHRLRATRKAFRASMRSSHPLGSALYDVVHIGIYNTCTWRQPAFHLFWHHARKALLSMCTSSTQGTAVSRENLAALTSRCLDNALNNAGPLIDAPWRCSLPGKSPFGEQAAERRNLEVDDAYGGKACAKRKNLSTIAQTLSKISRAFVQKRGMVVGDDGSVRNSLTSGKPALRAPGIVRGRGLWRRKHASYHKERFRRATSGWILRNRAGYMIEGVLVVGSKNRRNVTREDAEIAAGLQEENISVREMRDRWVSAGLLVGREGVIDMEKVFDFYVNTSVASSSGCTCQAYARVMQCECAIARDDWDLPPPESYDCKKARGADTKDGDLTAADAFALQKRYAEEADRHLDSLDDVAVVSDSGTGSDRESASSSSSSSGCTIASCSSAEEGGIEDAQKPPFPLLQQEICEMEKDPFYWPDRWVESPPSFFDFYKAGWSFPYKFSSIISALKRSLGESAVLEERRGEFRKQPVGSKLCLLYAYNNLVRCAGRPDLSLSKGDMVEAAVEYSKLLPTEEDRAKEPIEKDWSMGVLPLAVESKLAGLRASVETHVDPLFDSDELIGYIAHEPRVDHYVSFTMGSGKQSITWFDSCHETAYCTPSRPPLEYLTKMRLGGYVFASVTSAPLPKLRAPGRRGSLAHIATAGIDSQPRLRQMERYPLIALQGVWKDRESGSVVEVYGEFATIGEGRREGISTEKRTRSDGYLDPGYYARRGRLILIHIREDTSTSNARELAAWACADHYGGDGEASIFNQADSTFAQCWICLSWRNTGKAVGGKFRCTDAGVRCEVLTIWERPKTREKSLEYIRRASELCPSEDPDYNAAKVIASVGDGEFKKEVDDFTIGRISGKFWASDWLVAFALEIYAQMYILSAPERWVALVSPETIGSWRRSKEPMQNPPELRRSPDEPLLIIAVYRLGKDHYVVVEVYVPAAEGGISCVVYDPYGSPAPGTMKLGRVLCSSIIGILRLPPSTVATVKAGSVSPRQSNPFDCGFLCLSIVREILFGLESRSAQNIVTHPYDVSLVREAVATDIFRYMDSLWSVENAP